MTFTVLKLRNFKDDLHHTVYSIKITFHTFQGLILTLLKCGPHIDAKHFIQASKHGNYCSIHSSQSMCGEYNVTFNFVNKVIQYVK